MVRKQEIQSQIESLKAQIASGVSMHAEGTYRQQIAELEKELEQIEETEAREQKTGELLDEYNDTLNRIFDAMFPEEKFAAFLGKTDYDQLRQDYKRVHHAYHSGQIEKIHAEHAAEIENWREKFGRLTTQAQETENQLAEARAETGRLNNQLELVEQRNLSLKEECQLLQNMYNAVFADRDEYVNKYNSETEKLANENVQLTNKIKELEGRLDQTIKTKEPVKTEALDNVLNEIISRKQMDPDELMRRFEARQQNGPKVMAIDHGSKNIELLELPFRGEMVTKPVEQSPDPLPTVITETQFQGSSGDMGESAVRTEDGNGTDGDTPSSADDEKVSLTARIEALEADVAKLKLLNGMVA